MSFVISCTNNKSYSLDHINNPLLEDQVKLKKIVQSIAEDAMIANIENLQQAHLVSNKFTKFGPRNFYRQNVESTNKSEAEFFSSISNLKLEVKDLKIDVFGNVGVATYYPHFTFEKEGEINKGISRQTLVFINTSEGWKIVHEHGTPKF